MTGGIHFETKSTWGKEGEGLKLQKSIQNLISLDWWKTKVNG